MAAKSRARRNLLATVVICTGIVGLASIGGMAAAAVQKPSYIKRGAVHCVEARGYLYTFDAIWRVETLRRVDPSTGTATPVTDAEKLGQLRTALLAQLKVRGLDGVPAEGKADLDSLRALGYL